MLGEPEAREKQRSRESLNSDTVKYESGPDGGEEVSMSVEWNGVSAVHSPRRYSRHSPLLLDAHVCQRMLSMER